MPRRVTVHPVAAQGFGSTVDAYRRSRPSYPAEAVAWLVDALGLSAGRVVADVGAGTGKFSELLVPTGAHIVAVEPLASMREGFAADLPAVEVVPGSAEAIPLDERSADAIVAAQAFHWFDPSRALPEMWRVLRPGGRLGVIWNDLDVSVGWVAEFNSVIDVPRRGTPHPSVAGKVELAPWFREGGRASFRHAHMHTPATLIERVQSMSFVAVQPKPVRAKVFATVADLMARHPDLAGRASFELPYVTDAFWAERLEL